MKVSSSIGAVKCLFLNEREPYWGNKHQHHTATSVENPLQDLRWEKISFPPTPKKNCLHLNCNWLIAVVSQPPFSEAENE